MSTPPPGGRALPAVPNLEQQKKQARELWRAANAHDPAALRRLREHHPRLGALPDAEWPNDAFLLHEAQLVIAREYGFASWPRLKAHIEATIAERRTHPIERELSWYEERAQGLLSVLADGAAATLDQVRSWHPAFAEATDEVIRTAAFTIDDARLVYARQHGATSWRGFARHLTRINAGEAAEPFLDVLEAGKRRDWGRVNAILEANPGLVRARGSNGNSLLNLAAGLVACATPGGTGRADGARPGPDRLMPVRYLLGLGADPNQTNVRGWTPLHQAAYADDPELAALLLSAGARVDLEAHGSGGTPLVFALFWGNRAAADLLAETAAVPANLRVAAGLGRPDLVHACFTPSGELTPAARAARGCYRPHSGFGPWRPSDDPQEILGEALVWAAKSDRVEVMPLLVERGARVAADPYRGTPLIWAAANGRVNAATWLLDHGADVNQRATFGGPGHGQGVTALHIAAQSGKLAVSRLLVERGADLTIRDDLYHGTPANWAEHGCAKDVVELLKARE